MHSQQHAPLIAEVEDVGDLLALLELERLQADAAAARVGVLEFDGPRELRGGVAPELAVEPDE